MSSKPQPEQSTEQLLADVRLRNLTPDFISALDRALRPDKEEIAGMIQSIRRRKRWNIRFFAALLRITPEELSRYERKDKLPTAHVMLLIWLFHTMDTAPALAFSLVHIATWGKLEARLPRTLKPLEGDARQAAIAELREFASKPRKKKMSRQQVAVRYGMGYQAVGKLCEEAGYRPADGRKRMYRKAKTPLILRPESIWMNVDWRDSIQKIAKDNDTHPNTVRNSLRKLQLLSKMRLRRQIQNLGLDEVKFERILNPPQHIKEQVARLKIRRAKNKNNTRLTSNNTQPTLAGTNDEQVQEKERVGAQTQVAVDWQGSQAESFSDHQQHEPQVRESPEEIRPPDQQNS